MATYDEDGAYKTGEQLLAQWNCRTRQERLERAVMALMEQLDRIHEEELTFALKDALDDEEVTCSCMDAYRMGRAALDGGRT